MITRLQAVRYKLITETVNEEKRGEFLPQKEQRNMEIKFIDFLLFTWCYSDGKTSPLGSFPPWSYSDDLIVLVGGLTESQPGSGGGGGGGDYLVTL